MPPMPPIPPPPVGRRLVFRKLADRRFGGDQQAGDRGRVLEGGADDLGRVDHAGRNQVLVGVGLGVEAEVWSSPSSSLPEITAPS